MTAKPYITYPEEVKPSPAGGVTAGAVTPLIYVSEPGKVSFGVLNFVPGLVPLFASSQYLGIDYY